MLDPQSPQGLAISNLFIGLLFVGLCVLLLVVGLVTNALVKYRFRPGMVGEPSQDHAGSSRQEILWVLGPVVILIGVFIATVITMNASDPKVPDRQADITVIGHQWWWEYRYNTGPQKGIVTANELHVQAGTQYLLELYSADVQHEFWVPNLSRQQEIFPGQVNRMMFQADTPGSYEGMCNQFCGVEHAWMRFRTVVQSPQQYAAWTQQQLTNPPAPSLPNVAATPSADIGATPTGAATNPAQFGVSTGTERPWQTGETPIPAVAAVPQSGTVKVGSVSGDFTHGAQLFQQLTCVSCHYIANANTQSQANPKVGPNLTHVGSRSILAAGVLVNTPENMRAWLLNPQDVKPGNHMPNLNLTDQEANDLTVYLESLK